MISLVSTEWSVVVFKCESEKARDMLVSFYRFIEDLRGIKDVHFLIRDRLDDEVVFSFRILFDSKEKKDLTDRIAFTLGSLIPEDNFAVDPPLEHTLYKYSAWPWSEIISKRGSEKFTSFYSYLSRLSRIVVDMAEKNYFTHEERTELAHVASWMLGCTEYGLLDTKGWEVGYYDRVNDKYCPYKKHTFNVKKMMLKIYSDGASRGNPGLSAIAFLILSEDCKVLKQYSKYLGLRTNNQAEYEALISALESASTLKGQEVICYLDSELVTKQLNGEYKVRNSKLKILWLNVQEFKQRFQKISFVHVSRTNSYIQEVDRLANRVLDRVSNSL